MLTDPCVLCRSPIPREYLPRLGLIRCTVGWMVPLSSEVVRWPFQDVVLILCQTCWIVLGLQNCRFAPLRSFWSSSPVLRGAPLSPVVRWHVLSVGLVMPPVMAESFSLISGSFCGLVGPYLVLQLFGFRIQLQLSSHQSVGVMGSRKIVLQL